MNWLEAHMLSCPSQKYLHLQCPGCGLQRSMLALLRGEFFNSLSLYPATMPILVLLAFTILHLKFKFTKGTNIIVFMQITVAIVIAVFYIYKIIHHQIIA